MGRSLLADAFGHHVWATLELIDACLAVDPEQLETSVPGTFGSILATMRHIVGADASFLTALTGERVPAIDHRSQVCTALTVLGFEPPEIGVADFAWQDGRLVEVPATA